jgi:ribosomal protein S27AE
MAFTQTAHEGYLMIDHRASPGIPEDVALKMGLNPSDVGEGTLYETPTMGCAHCGTVVIINPKRTRSRAYCGKCNRYICDNCEHLRHQPDYVHTSIQEIKDKAFNG